MSMTGISNSYNNSSMDELIAKINEVDWNKVKEESNIGSRFDFSV